MSEPVAWKHIGLHGDAVGTFVCEPNRIVWKSAITGGNTDDVMSTTTRAIPAKLLKKANWNVIGNAGFLRIQTDLAAAKEGIRHEYRFDGFPLKDFELLQSNLRQRYKIELHPITLSAAGAQYGLTNVARKNLIFRHCVLDEMNEEGQEFEPRAEEEMMSLDLAEVSQCVLPGNNRNEIEVQFPESDTIETGTDQLVAIRMYVPPDPDTDPQDKETPSAAENLQKEIMATANIRKTTGDVLVSFPQEQGTFLTPRGRYAIELYATSLRLRGQKYDYKIRYDDINRLFLLPKPDEIHMCFVIALDKPIRQGQQRYPCLVLQVNKEQDEVTVNLDAETLEKEYKGELQPVMRGSLSNLIAKTFKLIANKKVLIPGKFSNAFGHPAIQANFKANDGLLYPLEKQFVFIHKPAILVRFNEIESVEFQRYAGGQGSTRNFDLCVNLKQSVSGIGGSGQVRDYTFSGIARTDYAGLYNFLSGKKIPIKNLQGDLEEAGPSAPVYNEDEIYGGPDDGMGGESSEDEDFDEEAAAEEEQADSDDSEDSIDDDEMGSEVDDELDSDLEAIREEQGGGKKKSKKRKKTADDETTASSPKKRKKDPNAPKKPQSAFMLYSTKMRNKIKEENPDSSFGDLSRMVGEKFKALSDDDRQKWDKRAAADKERYKTEMASYEPPDNSDESEDDEPTSKKAKKSSKDPNAPKRNKSAWMYFSEANRDDVRKSNPEASFGDIGKLLSQKWKEISSDEKDKFDSMAAKDKARYQAEMAGYKPPKGSLTKRAGKKKKDPNAPKRATNAFMFFSNEMRPKIKAENPDLKMGEVGKRLGELYREMPADEKEKYDDMAKEEKVRYEKEMAAYKNNQDGLNDDDEASNKANEFESSDDDSSDDE